MHSRPFASLGVCLLLGGMPLSLGACGNDSGNDPAGGSPVGVDGGGSGGSAGGSGCGSESFAAIYNDIFASQAHACADATACHGRDKSALATVGNLDLSSARAAYDGLVGVVSTGPLCGGEMVRVVAGDAQNSLLVQKLRADTVPCGASMPVQPTGSPLSDTELQRIEDWINAGACDN